MTTILSLYPRHDANLTVATDSSIITYLEFEKIAKKRYFAFDTQYDKFKSQFTELTSNRINHEEISDIVLNWTSQDQERALSELFPKVNSWRKVNHHISHVWSAYMFTEPRENDLIVSYDGGGDLNDFFKAYCYRNNNVHELLESKINLGKPYRLLGLLSPELYHERDKGYRMDLPLSGKKMALVALGVIQDEYLPAVRDFYRYFELKPIHESFRTLLDRIGFKGEDFLPEKEARDLLATSQHVFEETFARNVHPFLDEGVYSRLVLVGGCALNVTVNSKTSKKYGIEIFVPPCPNDCGISIGIQRLINPAISKLPAPTMAVEPTRADVSALANRYSEKDFDMQTVAHMLAEGKIIGTFRGPLEIGPRALGNRSYLANPFKPGMKDRVNALKGREWWRPVAPIVSIDKMSEYFETEQSSPYMSFAPNVRPEYEKRLGEIIHYDGTARIQTVKPDDGWIYLLVKEFGKLSGMDVIMNTSFNIKGEPLINDYADAIAIFSNTDLDALVIEDVIYSKKG